MIERLFANVNVISQGIEQIGKFRYNPVFDSLGREKPQKALLL